MRTQEEIVVRILEKSENDFLGFETSEYYGFLDYAHAKPFLKHETPEEDWNRHSIYPSVGNLLVTMLGYMPFAWEKANDCRGISAIRSIDHYKAWLWLMDDGFLEQFNAIEYEHYGKEMLIAVCEKYEWNWKQWDNGIRSNRG